MKCEDFEQTIYLYSELSESERFRVDAHIQTCVACKELSQRVLSTQGLIEQAALAKPDLVNHARLTSTIMQAITAQQQQSTSWISNLFLKYTMVAGSLALIIAFGVEQLSPVGSVYKRMPETNTVTLNSASFMKAALDRKENPEAVNPSFYACVKSGDCNNPLIESLKKKSL